jgi:Type IV secretory pathway, protease TraF
MNLKRKLKALFFLSIFSFILYGSLPKIFIFNHTASLPVGWYLILPVSSGNYAVGDYVVFSVPDDIEEIAVSRGWLKKGEPMLKQIGGVDGDSYRILENQQFWAKDKYVGQVLPRDHESLPMPTLRPGTYRVEATNFLPVGTHVNSFDGRYYGTVPLLNIKSKVIPLLTWE